MVYSTSGGVRAVRQIYYYEGACYAITEVDWVKEVNHQYRYAPDLATAITEYTQYALAVGEKIDNAKRYYYSTLYVDILDYTGTHDLLAYVFEYGINEDGQPTGEYDIRKYRRMDLLYLNNPQTSGLPEYDLKMLRDYKKLTDELDEIYR